MSDKTFTAGQGDEIIIKIRRKKKPEIRTNTAKRRGLISPKIFDDYLPRRIKKGGFIKFRDLGQVLMGESYQNRAFSIAGTPSTASPPENDRILTASDFLDRDSLYLTSEGVLTDEGREIDLETGDVFGIQLYGSGFDHSATTADAKWTDKGLELTDIERAADNITVTGTQSFSTGIGDAQRYFPYFILSGDSKNHITSECVRDAPAAEYHLGKSDIIYLCPEINEIVAKIKEFTPDYVLGYTYCFYPRKFDGSTVEFYRNGELESGTDADFIAAATLAGNQPNALAFERVGSDYETMPPEDFADKIPSVDDLTLVSYQPIFYIDQLAAIIKQGENWFYVWR